MARWQDGIVKDILQAEAMLVIAADPDGLLAEESIQQEIRSRRFDFITYDDPAIFRYEYESKYRTKWDAGVDTGSRVLLRTAARNLENMPYDLLMAGHTVELSIGNLFPGLSYPVIEKLPPAYIDKLNDAYAGFKHSAIGEGETCDFILQHVFQIIPELIKEPVDLLKNLLRIHYEKEEMPPVLCQRLVAKLQQKALFTSWPLKTLFCDGDAFFQFLQERWPIFLDRIANDNTASREPRPVYKFNLEGPSDLPFEHKDIHIYMDNLFLEGLLQPVRHEATGKKLLRSYKWARAGLVTGANTEEIDNLEMMLDNLEDAIPTEEARYLDWLNFAAKWAHLNMLRYSIFGLADSALERRITDYQAAIDQAFDRWLSGHYAGLYNMPPVPPVMLHHIPRAMAQVRLEQDCRVALLVIDGMGYDQWLVIKNILLKKGPDIKFRESAVFAWAPTITSISRQSLFAGKIPSNFASSFSTTTKEPVLWEQFWLQQGMSKDAIAYIKGLGEDVSLAGVEEAVSSPGIKILGLVVDKLDKIMHGIELGASGMQGQVKQWTNEGFLEKLMRILVENKFQIFLTSDHGNIESKGCGRPMEGAIADLKGERVRIYNESTLRASVADKFPGSIEWPAIGLPDDCLPLMAPGRSAFILEGHRTVTHGGTCIEELIVPLVQVDRRSN